ncbi:MAG TPA: dihydropteroate synthase [Fibrobacteria bacterium]|nr:dihydropteroate synthase [Fibrobacteria bacterium]
MASWGHPLKSVRPRPWRAGDRVLGGDRPLIMGILNVTPDSFHDGGLHSTADQALRHAEAMLEAGADILDVGGESSRPGAEPVPEAEELARTLPSVRGIVKRFDCPVSIDTVKANVARAALAEGACIVNDISAMTFDPMMLEVPLGFRAGVVLNHIKGTPKDMQQAPAYADVSAEVAEFLKGRIQVLAAMGVAKDRIAVDPGIGFGKRLEDNYGLIGRMEDLDALGCPILLGMSRKSFIGKTAGLEHSDRLFPSVALAVLAALKGASILRVHDVRETREALAMVAAVRAAL